MNAKDTTRLEEIRVIVSTFEKFEEFAEDSLDGRTADLIEEVREIAHRDSDEDGDMTDGEMLDLWEEILWRRRELADPSQRSYSWQEMAELTHATQVQRCEEGETFPYDDCPRPAPVKEEWKCPQCGDDSDLLAKMEGTLCGKCIRKNHKKITSR